MGNAMEHGNCSRSRLDDTISGFFHKSRPKKPHPKKDEVVANEPR
jgi:hypothetical protein